MTSLPTMNGRDLGHEFPCSQTQLALLAAGGSAARVGTLALSGPLDSQALVRSLSLLVDRYEILRTVLRETGEPEAASLSDSRLPPTAWVQCVLDRPSGWLAEYDHRALPPDERETALEELVREYGSGCSRPRAEPLFRAALVQQASERWLCLLAASELVLDSFSFELLVEELADLYGKQTRPLPTPPSEPRLQYADWVLWQAATERATGTIRPVTERATGAIRPVTERATGTIRLNTDRAGDAWAMALEQAPVRTGSSYTERTLGPGFARRRSDSPQQSEATLGSALTDWCAQRGWSEPALLSPGRSLEHLSSILGPMQQLVSLGSPTGSGAVDDPGAGLDSPGAVAVAAVLTISRDFGGGVRARWADLAGQSPTLHAAGAGLTVRLLYQEANAEAGLDTWKLACWSRLLSSDELALAAEQMVGLLDPGGHGEPRGGGLPEPIPGPLIRTASELAGETPNRGDEPRDQVERTLAEIWSAVLQTPRVGRDENFFDLGGHSLLAVRIGTRIERAFRREIPLNAILELPTIAEFATLLRPAPASDSGDLVVRKTADDARPDSALPFSSTHAASGSAGAPDPEGQESTPPLRHRLVKLQEPGPGEPSLTPFFWIPGGRAISVLALREVSLLLGPDRPVYGVESRLPRLEEVFASVPERAREYLEVIRQRQPQGPYLLAGFCVGGMVAFEMAQQLRREGEQVGFLGLIQASTPGFPATPGLRRRMERQRHLYLARTMLSFLAMRFNPWRERKSRAQQQEILDRVAKLVTGWVGTSSQLPDPTQQTNGQAMRAYRPKHYPGQVHVYLAQDCFESAGIAEDLDPRRAWAGLADSAEISVMPGDHVSMLTQGPARTLAAAIDRALPR